MKGGENEKEVRSTKAGSDEGRIHVCQGCEKASRMVMPFATTIVCPCRPCAVCMSGLELDSEDWCLWYLCP